MLNVNELEPSVFVVNCKLSVRKSLADLLSTNGYSVEIFASAAQSLARVCCIPAQRAFWSNCRKD
jgi:FixJ family two-component response regulator